MKPTQRILGVIPARGGSKGIPRKNVIPVAGKNLISYTIEAALNESIFDQIIVSTDDDEIASVSNQFEVDVIMRPPEFATDEAPIDLALRHAVEWSESNRSPVNIVVWLQANVPHRRRGVIKQAVDKLVETGATSVLTVVPYRVPPQWAWRLIGDKMIPLEGCYRYTVRRQDAVQAYHPDGAVVVMRRDILMESLPQSGTDYLGNDRRAIVQSEEYGIEVDEPFDLEICESILGRRKQGLGLS